MKKILKIAKLELSVLFFAPVAWLVLVIFFLQSGNRFLGLFGSYQEAIAMGNQVSDLTFAMFPGTGGLFEQTLQNIYFYIPLLSMGLMSREISSGSIKLLLSSPVTVKEIIFGKYLAITLYGFLLVMILVVYAVTGAVLIRNADYGLIASGLLALFLLICTYAAIGLFMSSLTGYQVVAAISTLAVFAALQYVGSVGQGIDFVRDFTYFLSISGRTDDLLKGLISSRDVIYFLLIIGLFISLSILRLKAARSPQSAGMLLMKYTGIIVAVLLMIYLSSRPQFIWYKDLTANKVRTLTPNSQAVAKQIKGDLVITTYVNLLDQNVYAGLPVSRNLDMSRFDAFRRYIPGLKMKYVYYYDITDLKNNRNMVYQGDLMGFTVKQVAEKVADNMGLDVNDFMSPADIRKRIDLSSEDNNFIRVLEYKGRTSKLRLYDEMDAFPSETEITAAIKRLIVPAAQIAVITGHNERSILKTGERNYESFLNAKKVRRSLINQGFDVSTIRLDSNPVPDRLSLLILADPATALKPAELAGLKSYIDNGGNLMITTEPGQQQLINPILKWVDIQLKEGTLVMPSTDNLPDQVITTTFKEGMPVAMPGVSALQYYNSGVFIADTLLMSAANGWNKQGELAKGSTDISYHPDQGDVKGSYPTAIALRRTVNGKVQKIFVSGDADFISNKELSQPKGMNQRFSTKLFKWFANGEFPIDTRRPEPKDNEILLKKRKISTLKLVFTGLIPLLIGLLGAYIIISRKRK
jgi:ABC-2 type transport system permease protein